MGVRTWDGPRLPDREPRYRRGGSSSLAWLSKGLKGSEFREAEGVSVLPAGGCGLPELGGEPTLVEFSLYQHRSSTALSFRIAGTQPLPKASLCFEPDTTGGPRQDVCTFEAINPPCARAFPRECCDRYTMCQVRSS